MPPTRVPLADRFWPKVDQRGPILTSELGACWLWTAARNPRSGYGQIGAGGKYGIMLLAHRVAYELTVGPIPAGLTLDHLCNRRDCVNPGHLEPCTTQVNSARGAERRDMCRSGAHPWEGNAYTDPSTGRRRCRACNTEKAREYRRRSRTRSGTDAPLHDALPAASGEDI